MATELGKAYVQIMPSAKGITGAIQRVINPEAVAAGDSAGKTIGQKLVGALKGTVVAAGIGKFLKTSLLEGGDLQQSLGGIETLFKENADKVKQYANEAYKTAGLSANDYMTTVTSFSASLLQSLGGNTAKAADTANMALIDMSDNANKMGSSMESIQNAYQGFAKQNYTMLDNLKLGYGGTKTEMERLLKDAQKLTGVKYDISNLADVYNAIHAIQEELGITGTTALEASETLTGSFAAMKSAFSNFMGNLSLGQDLAPALKGLAETVSTFLFDNLIPMVMNIITGLPAAIMILITESIPIIIQALADAATAFAEWMQTGISDLISSASTIISNFIAVITESLPMILEIGQTIFFALYDGITANFPQITLSILELVGSIVATILSSLPSLSKAGLEIVLSFISGILSRLPSLGLVGLQLIGELVVAIISGLPKALELGGEIIANIIKGIVDSAKDLYAKGKEIIEKALDEIDAWKDKFFEAGANIVQSIADGIKDAIGKVTSAIKETVSEIRAHLPFSPAKKGPLKDLNKLDFGIIAEGIYNAKNPVANAMRALSQEAMDGFDAAGDIQKNVSYKASLDTGTIAKVNDNATEENQQNEILKELVQIVKDLKDKVEKLPDRQLMLARE